MVDISKHPPVLNLAFNGQQLWSSTLGIKILQKMFNSDVNSLLDGTPYDGTPVEIPVTVDISLTVVFIVLSTTGIVFTIICLAFNFIFRDRK